MYMLCAERRDLNILTLSYPCKDQWVAGQVGETRRNEGMLMLISIHSSVKDHSMMASGVTDPF